MSAAPPTCHSQQTQLPATAGAPGTRMPPPLAVHFQQLQQPATAGVPGTGMQVPPAAPFFQQQPLTLMGASGTGMPAPSFPPQITQLIPPSFTSGLPRQPIPAPNAPGNFTLSTAHPPTHHNTHTSCPSPVPDNIRKQIIDGNYVDLTLLLLPSLQQPSAARFLDSYDICSHLKGRSHARSRELTSTEFTYTFSLFRDILCSRFPTHRQELDDYLSIVLNLALHFGRNEFYQYHVHFASEAAARLHQFNEATYWGTLDSELYCRIFAARAALTCTICGASSHPTSSCSIPARVEIQNVRPRDPVSSRLAAMTPPHT
eukprot:superscaffoldBa00015183_g26537